MNDALDLTTGTHTPATRRGEETKTRILEAAKELIHRNGFSKTGLSEILEASGVPKGSFYFYFKSKDDLGRELLARYRERQRESFARDVFPPEGRTIPQIVAFFGSSVTTQAEGGCKSGCLLGNLAAELNDEHEGIRRELAAILLELKQTLAAVLARGQERGELRRDFEANAAAEFLLSVLEGSVLLAKARRDPTALRANSTMLARYLQTLETAADASPSAGSGGQR